MLPSSTFRVVGPGFLALAFTACFGEVAPSNPYDPGTSPEKQATATITGHVVLAEAGASVNGGTVRLLDAKDAPVLDEGGAPRSSALQPEAGDGEGAGLGQFTFAGLKPGSYHLAFKVDARFRAPFVPELSLAPGEEKSVGTLVFDRADVGTGRIHGTVELREAEAGARTVKVWRKVGQGMQVVTEQQTDAAGHFDVTGLPPGTYAVGAELVGFTPDFGFGLVLDAPGALTSDIALDGDAALVLHPVSAVLVPDLQRQFGTYYTKGREVPLFVLAFGKMTKMRLSTSPLFQDASGAEIPFRDYAASATVQLPEAEGTLPILAQFRAEESGFVFTSDVYRAEVVRDATPPSILDTSVRGLSADADGVVWIREQGATLAVDVNANDSTSGIAGYAIFHDANGAPTNPDEVPLHLVDSPVGFVSVNDQVTLTAGEGKKSIFVLLRDRAGNSAIPSQLDVVVDATAPALAAGETLVAANANPRGEIAERTAHLRVILPDDCQGPVPTADPGTCPVAMRFGTAPLSSASAFGPLALGADHLLDVPITGGNGQPVAFELQLRDAAGNVSTFDSPIYVLKLTGQASGRVLVQGYPDDAPNHGGITVSLFDPVGPRTTPVAVATTDADGRFTLHTPGDNPTTSISAGHYLVTCEREDLEPFETETDILENVNVALPAWRVSPARGNVQGRVVRGDLRASATGHGGVEVTAMRGGVLVARTFSADNGEFSFASPGVPVTSEGSTYDLLLSAAGYVTRRVSGVEIRRSVITILSPDSSTPPQPTPIELSKLSGDFQFCAALTGPCVPTLHTNQAKVRVKLLDDTGVTEIRAQARTRFDDTSTTPTWTTYDANGTLVDIAAPPNGAEGAVEVFVQTRVAGTPGAVLRSTVVYDHTPPTLGAFTIDSGSQAVRVGFTNESNVRATVSADAGSGDVAPLQGTFVAFATAAPTTVPAGATPCVAATPCTVPLPKDANGNVVEGLYTAYAFACDVAGNCSTTPASARIVYDATPPAATHGVSFVPSATWITQVAGEWYTRSTRLDVALGVGTARTAAGVDVQDLATPPQTVPDVVAYRFGYREDLADAAWSSFPTQPKAAQSLIVNGPTLNGDDGKYKIYAQFKDAAGNVTSVDANPRFFQVTLDQAPPVVAFELNGGASWATNATVRLDVTLAAGDPGPAREVLVSKDAGLFASFDRRALPLTGSDTSWTLPAAAAPDGDGSYTVIARFVDAAGNATDRAASIFLDRTPPTIRGLSCTTCRTDTSGLVSTNASNRQVTLDFAALDNSGRVATTKVVVDGGTAVTSTYTGTVVTTLPDLDGRHKVDVSVLDGAGNESAVQSLNINLDRVAPSISASINQGAKYATDGTVLVAVSNLDGSTLSGLRLSNSATFSGPVLPFTATSFWALATPELDGDKTVYVEVTDPAGNTTVASDTIVLDRTPPANVSLTLAGGAAYTTAAAISASIAATDAISAAGALRMQVSEDPTFAAATLDTFATSKSFTLSTGDGPKTVFLRVVDEAGNAANAFDTIVLDTDRPQGADITLSAGATTRQATTVATLTAAGATQMCLYGDLVGSPSDSCAAGSTAWEPIAASKSITLAGTDGTKVVNALFRDAAQLTTAAVSATTVLDRASPTGVSIAANAGAGFSSSATLALALAASDATSPGTLEMEVTEDATFASASWEPFQPQKSFTLSAAEGSKTLYFKVRDAAGNSASASTSIVYDKTSPTGVSVTIGTGALATSSASVALTIAGTDTLTSAANLKMMVSQDPTFAGAVLEAFATTKSLTLSGADGAKSVYVKVLDEAGNGTVASATVVLDTEKPSGERLVLTPAGNTSATGSTAAISASGASEMCLSGDFVGSPANCGTGSTGWEAFNASKALTLTSGDGAKVVTAVFRDLAKNVSGTASDQVVLDKTSPTGVSVAFSGASASVRSPQVTLAIAATDALTPAASLQMQVSEDPSFASATWEAFAPTRPFTLSSTDGSKTVYLRVRDLAGNTGSASANVVLDQAAPTGVSVNIASGASATSTASVSLAIAATDAISAANKLQMQVSEDPTFAGATWIAFATTKSWTLSAGDGTKTVYLRVQDEAGNITLASDTILLDTDKPSSPAISITQGAYVTSTSIAVALSATGATQMCLWGDFTGSPADCAPTSSGWTSYAATQSLVLTSGNGTKSVNVRFRDAALNVSTDAADTTVYDNVPPTGLTLSVNGGAGFTSASTVALALAATDATSGGLTMQVTEDSTFASASWESFVPQKAFTLSSTEGSKTVYFRARDAAGNTASTSATVVYDRSGPSSVSVTIAGGATYTSSPTVTLTLAATDNLTTATNLRMQLSQDPNFAGATTQAFATSKSFTLSGADGTKAVYLNVLDESGNATSASASIVLDTKTPTAPSVTLSSGAATQSTSAVATLAASGAVQMCLYGDFVGSPTDSCATSSTGWETYAASKALTLTSADGTKNVNVLFRNGAQVTTAVAGASTVLDRTAPISVSISANGGAAFTAVGTVPLTLAANDGTSGTDLEMQVTEDATFSSATWEPYVTQKTFSLSATEGSKSLYFRVRDTAGNITSASTGIVYDKTAPTGVSLAIAGGAAYTGTSAVTLTIAGTDSITSAANLKMMLSQDPTFSGASAQAFATSKSFTLAGADGTKSVYLKVIDEAGNATTASASIVLDTQTPSNAAISLSSGAFAKTTSVVAALSATNAVQMCLYGDFVGSPTDSCAASSTAWESYATSKSLTLTSADATKTVYAKFRNGSLLTSAAVSDATVLDRTSPASVSITASGGSGFTSTATIPLALAATDLTSGTTLDMQVTEDSTFASATWETYAAQKTFTLSSTEGSKTLYLRVRDQAGNTASASTSIVYDKTPPSSVSVTIASGAAYTSTASVSLTIAGSDNLTSAANLVMLVSQDPTFAGAAQEAFATTKSVTLAGADGAKSVYVKVLDQAGNATVASSSIVLDTDKPSNERIALSPAGTTSSTSVTATVGAGGAAEMCFFGDFVGSPAGCGPTSTGWEPYNTSKALTLTSGDGTKQVTVRFRDAALNATATATDSVVLDKTAPAGVSVAVAGASGFVRSPQVTLAIAATDAQTSATALQMQVTEDSTFASATWETYAPTRAFTLGSTDGSKTVYLRVRDLAGNIGTASTGVVLDQTAPTSVSVTVASGASYTGSTSVSLAIAATDAISAAARLQMEVSEDPTFAGASWAAYATSKSWTLSTGDGTKTVYLRVQDEAGNITLASDSIALDTDSPSAPSITIAQGAYTTSTSITASLAASGASQMCLWGDFVGSPAGCGPASSGWTTFAATQNLVLSAGNGTKVVNVRFRDGALNVSVDATASIVYDNVAPASLSFTINGGATTTTSTSVTLAIGATDAQAATSALQVQVSEDSSFSGATWESFAATRAFSLSSTDGAKTVYLRVRDPAGNIGSKSAGITLDQQPPTSVSISLASGATYTTTTAVTATIAATDAVTSAANLVMQVSEDPTFANASWIAFATSKAVTLSSGDQTKTVYLRVKDQAGNITVASDGIILDTQAPTGASISVQSGDYSNSTSLVLTLGATGATEMCIAGPFAGAPGDNCGSASSAGWETYATSKAITLVTASATNTFTAYFRDAAGNTTSGVTDSITYDTTAPTVSLVSLNGAAAFTTSPAITLDLTASDNSGGSGLAGVALSNTSLTCSTATYATYASRWSWTLSSGDGSKTVYVCVRDNAGNTTSASASITLDTTPPTGVSISLAGGSTWTTSAAIQVALTASDAISNTNAKLRMELSESPSFSGASLVTFANSSSFTLSSGDATKTVFVRVRDEAGNTAVANDALTLDTTPPGAGTPALTVNSGATATSSAVVTLQLFPTLDSNRRPTATRVKLRTYERPMASGACSSAPTVGATDFDSQEDMTYVPTMTYVLPPTETASTECKWIGLRFGDDAGNWTAVSLSNFTSILLDTTAPQTPQIDTPSQTVNLTAIDLTLALNSTDAHFAKYQALYAGGTTWTDVATSTASGPFITNPACVGGTSPLCTITVPLSGSTSGQNKENLVAFRGVDVAGNTSAEATVIITKDGGVPAKPTGLTATPGDARIALSWTAVTDADLGGYYVRYALSATGSSCPSSASAYDGAFAEQGVSPIDVGHNTSLLLTGMPNGVTVCVAVSSYDRTDIPGPRESTLATIAITPYEVAPQLRSRLTNTQLGLAASDKIGAVGVRNGLLYAATTAGLIELDVSNEGCFDLPAYSDFQACTGLVRSSTALADPRDMVIHGRYVFIADGTAGLKVFAITEGLAPSYVRTVTISGVSTVTGVAASGNLLAAAHPSGYALMTLGSNGNPAVQKIETAMSTTQDVDLQGNLMVIARNSATASQIFDVTTPSAPTAVAACDFNDWPSAVRISGHYAYFLTSGFTLEECDLTSSLAPRPVRSIASVDGRARIEILGPYLFAAGQIYDSTSSSYLGYVDVLDISDKYNLRNLGRYNMPGQPVSGYADFGAVAVEANRAFLATGQTPNLDVLHLGEPRSLDLIASDDSVTGSRDTRLVKDVVISPYYSTKTLESAATSRRSGNLVFENEATATIAVKATELEGDRVAFFQGSSYRVGHLADQYLATGILGDLATYVAPTPAGGTQWDISAGAFQWPYLYAVAMSKNTTTLNWTVQLQTIDYRQTSSPYVTTSAANTAVLANTYGGSQDNPTLGSQMDVSLYGGNAYVGVQTYTPGQQQADEGLWRVPYNFAGGLSSATRVWTGKPVAGTAMYGRTLFLWTTDGYFYAQPMTGTFAPILLGTAGQVAISTTNGAVAMYRPQFAGNYIFVPRGYWGFRVFKLTYGYNAGTSRYEPTGIAQVLTYDYGSMASGVFVAGDRVYVTNQERSTDIFRLR